MRTKLQENMNILFGLPLDTPEEVALERLRCLSEEEPGQFTHKPIKTDPCPPPSFDVDIDSEHLDES